MGPTKLFSTALILLGLALLFSTLGCITVSSSSEGGSASMSQEYPAYKFTARIIPLTPEVGLPGTEEIEVYVDGVEKGYMDMSSVKINFKGKINGELKEWYIINGPMGKEWVYVYDNEKEKYVWKSEQIGPAYSAVAPRVGTFLTVFESDGAKPTSFTMGGVKYEVLEVTPYKELSDDLFVGPSSTS